VRCLNLCLRHCITVRFFINLQNQSKRGNNEPLASFLSDTDDNLDTDKLIHPKRKLGEEGDRQPHERLAHGCPSMRISIHGYYAMNFPVDEWVPSNVRLGGEK